MILPEVRDLIVRSSEEVAEAREALEQSRTAADPVDQANSLVELDRLSGISAVRSELSGKGQDWCEDCGEEIPQERRAVVPWSVRCAPCQELEELRARQGS